MHRGVYRLSARSTELYEEAREKVRRFLGAADAREIVFVRNATEAINLVANSWGATFLKAGDEVLLTVMEHHANIVPWQLLRDRIGIKLVVAPIDATGGLDMAKFAALIGPRTKLVAVTHVANVTGAVLPVESIVRLAHAAGAKVLIDGCQAAPRLPVDLRALDCDFYVFSGHKTYGPTGIGVLYGKKAILDAMPPWQGGGDMILEVTFERTTFQEPPHRFEAGTPDISGAIGLGIAIDYLEALGREAIFAHEEALTGYGVDVHLAAPRRPSHRRGAAAAWPSCPSPSMASIRTTSRTILDQHQVAVRAGHHCAQPFMDVLGVGATTRASLGIYNDENDIDAFAQAIQAAQKMFKR